MAKFLTSALALIATTLTSNVTLARENSYQLVCRKGAGMSITIASSPNDLTWIELTFKRGTEKGGIGNSKIGSGECAYIDRPVFKSEPNVMFHRTDVSFTSKISLGSGQRPEFQTYIELGSSDSRPRADLQRFLHALNTQEYFTIEAYKKDKKYMEITRFY